ncbi:right-handed parallel beta-helix repeat-containing protein, partial [Calditrichota bacterium]
MKKKSIFLACIAVSIMTLLSVTSVFAVDVQGEVNGTWDDEGGYRVIGDIEVPARDSLIILPGVQVTFADDYDFTVYGTLYAIGEEADSVRFDTYARARGSWSGIIFSGSYADGSVLDYCSIPWGNVGITVEDANPRIYNCRISHTQNSGILVEGGAPRFDSCIIAETGQSEDTAVKVLSRGMARFNNCKLNRVSGNGIAAGEACTAFITNCEFDYIGLYAINLATATSCSLSGNFIFRPGVRGISVDAGSLHYIDHNIIDGAGAGAGIWIRRGTSINIINNTIMNNYVHGIQTYESSVTIINNIVTTNGDDGLAIQGDEVTAGYNVVYGNQSDNYNGIEAPATDINDSPGLDDDYFPQEGSVCIDAGDARYPDPDGTRGDIGARFFNQNDPPVIVDFSPELGDEVAGDQEITFSITAVDSNDHILFYTWYLNGIERGYDTTFTYLFNRDGSYEVLVVVKDGYYLGTAAHGWDFEIRGSDAPFEDDLHPTGFELAAPYPNPFNSTARLDLTAFSSSDVKVELFDITGRKTLSLWDGLLQPGIQTLLVDGVNLPEGVYLV